MRQAIIFITLASALMLVASGCITEPGLDKGKFAELNRVAEELKAAIRSGKPCELPDTLVQRFIS